MKKVSIALLAVVLMAGCATLAGIAAKAILFVQTVDEQKTIYCEAGYLPPAACELYDEYRAKAMSAWTENKDKFIDWVIEYILNNVKARAGADVSIEELSSKILTSAEINLTRTDYLKLKVAVEIQ